MGKKYIHAEMDITEFDVEDVIMTSTAGEDTGGYNPDSEDDF